MEENRQNRIEGRHGVLEAFRAGQLVERLFVQKGCNDGPVLTILREAKKVGTMVDFVPKDRLSSGHGMSAGAYSPVQVCQDLGGIGVRLDLGKDLLDHAVRPDDVGGTHHTEAGLPV